MIKHSYRIDYCSAVHWCNNQYILLNNIHELDPEFEDPYCEDEDGNPREIFQYFVSDCSDFDKSFLCGNFPDLLFSFSDRLQKWVLCVDHYGTAWDYVFCDVSPISDIPNIWCKHKRKLNINIRRDFIVHFKRW